MVQERARRGVDAHLVAVARHVEPIERLHRRLRLAFGDAEGREIVLADQPLRRRVHRLGIERARHAPGARALQREIGAAVDDAVEIVPLPRREARVEIVGDLLGRRAPRPDAAADARSSRRAPCRSRQSFARSTCATCPSACTPASVRPAPCTVTRLAAERRDRVGQHALHRRRHRPGICQPANGVPSYSMVSL